ncbi:hypothetical protein LXL04_026906 [Taraxacum kok-saghyz]
MERLPEKQKITWVLVEVCGGGGGGGVAGGHLQPESVSSTVDSVRVVIDAYRLLENLIKRKLWQYLSNLSVKTKMKTGEIKLKDKCDQHQLCSSFLESIAFLLIL